ncbi:Gfo/Idh/MocA family oxidoreductase [Leptospira noguchii]|uniref:Gfo/Idh/MocA family oxidoreductase n=1 Tax=Leptospira noguchii TaxID=28182 RepID=UPI0007730C35|nr:Gfo/Idh/MocA family oxidoreductase [Leptospira noguchii]
MDRKKIAIVGGSRWARTIAGVLCEFLPENYVISMHSLENADGLKSWVKEKQITQITVYNTWPDYTDSIYAVIIANAARNHFTAAVSSLLAGIPTLVEKPLATNQADAEFLLNLASLNGTNLYCAHVLLYANYLNNYAQIVRNNFPFKQIKIVWSDPINEERYGEVKHYDPSISLIHDIIPHILSIMKSLTDEEISIKDTIVENGGSRVTIRGLAGLTSYIIILERNSNERLRILEVDTVKNGLITLDFSNEPGLIRYGDLNDEVGDPYWGQKPGPLRAMLESFFEIATSGENKDHRLDPILGLEACRFSDMAFRSYRSELVKWFSNRSEKKQNNKDLKYAIDEIFHDSVFTQNSWKESFLKFVTESPQINF